VSEFLLSDHTAEPANGGGIALQCALCPKGEDGSSTEYQYYAKPADLATIMMAAVRHHDVLHQGDTT